MTGMTKSEQWLKAAQVRKYLAKSHHRLSEIERDTLALAYLERELPTAPWEYPWHEVIRSLRDRSANRFTKQRV